MVHQGSFFQRLKERWGSGSGVRVDRRPDGGSVSSNSAGNSAGSSTSSSSPALQRGAASAKPPVAATRVDAERAGPTRDVSTAFAPADARSSRKLSEREEAMMALGTHFQDLTTLLRGSQARTDEQMQKLVDATTSLGALPTLSQQQLDMLRSLSSQMERQNVLGEQLATTMTRLPNLLENVEAALQRAAATDQRTAATVREFQTTMDRIHSSMTQMVQHSDQQSKASQQLAERRDQELKGLAEGITRSQESTVSQLRRTTDEGLQSLRRTHEDQSNRLQKVVQEHAGWNRAVLLGIGLVLLGVGAVLVLQLFR